MRFLLHLIILFFTSTVSFAQTEEVLVIDADKKPRISEGVIEKNEPKKYNPNIAIRRSAFVPGWGQATNKNYWKIPIVYGALGTTSYLFFRNLKQYNESKDAYILATDNDPSNDHLIKEPYFTVKDQPDRIRNFRNQVRQNVDYSALFFIIFWGLNVVDAAVDAHLKTFDVSDDLSIIIKPGHNELANTHGLSLILKIGK